MLDRRSFLGAASAAVAVSAVASSKAPTSNQRTPIVIDGQGQVADASWVAHAGKFNAQTLEELRASGLTACSMALGRAGKDADIYAQSNVATRSRSAPRVIDDPEEPAR